MRRLFTFFVLVLISFKSIGQSSLNNALKVRISDRTLAEEFTVLVKGDISKLRNHTSVFNYKFNYSAGEVASVTLGLDALSRLIENKIVEYAEFIEPHKQVMNDSMVVRNRIKGIKTGAFPLPQSYDGTGVVVGIIDTGTDWRHDDFKDGSGQTRIKWIWDQKVFGGSLTPMPYNYGIEWTAAMIDGSVCTHDDVAGNSHGTHVAGIAAGDGSATGANEGCAPKADLVVVSLDFNKSGPTIADGVSYIFSKATLLGKPCVINASVGDYYGSHDGTDLEAKLIEGMVKNVPGRVMVAAAGNGGTTKFHTLTQPPANDTVFTWITKNTSSLNYWTYADTNQIKNIQFNVGANRSDWSNLGSIGFKNYNYGISGIQSDTLKLSGNRIGIIKTSASINAYGVYELYLQINADTLNLLWRIESKGAGLHHAWNFDLVSTGLPTLGQYPRISKYVTPDTLYSMVSSFQCLDDITVVANYGNLAQYYDYNNNLQPALDVAGGKVANSSVGPTRDSRLKPDISASGNGVFSAAAVNLQASWISAIPQFMAPGGQHVFGTGTSASSPVVAGFAALFLQSNPNLTSNQVRNAIANCAYSDGHTGTVPNFAWGFGKLDGKASMMCILTGKNEIQLKESDGNVYPNPSSGNVSVEFLKEVYGEVFVYTVDGKLLLKDKIAGDKYEIKKESLPSGYRGLLILRVVSPEASATFKLIRE